MNLRDRAKLRRMFQEDVRAGHLQPEDVAPCVAEVERLAKGPRK